MGLGDADAAKAPSSVCEVFEAAARAASGLPFLAYPSVPERPYLPMGAEFTYGEALSHVLEMADAYKSAGYGVGHRVALVLGNRPDYFWHFLALNSLGACALPLNPDYMVHEFAWALEQANACLAVACGESASRVADAVRGLDAASVDLNEGFAPPAPRRSPLDNPTVSERAALIIYTSGTTSRPKGCLISNASCLASGKSYVDVGGLITLRPDKERLYVPLPTFHMNATVLALNAMILQRGCLVSTDRFRASSWWREIRESRATGVHYLGLIPPILLKAPPATDEGAPTVRFGVGAGVDPSLHAAFESRFGFPLVEVWGMTETSRLIANAHEPRHVDTRAFGRPHPPWEVMIADEEGRPILPGQPGELLVRCAGPDPRNGFFSGYVKDEEATTAAWLGGWFHTGDVVAQDTDGMLYFVERRKNIIRRSGENIAACEIEEVIIADAAVEAVVALAVPDALRDEEVLACIVLIDGHAGNEESAHAIIEAARDRLALHKLPGWIQFVDTVPVTPTQKVRKDVLLAGFDPEAGSNLFDTRNLKARRPRAQT